MNAESFLNAYIDLNLLLFAGTALWLALRAILTRSRLGPAFRPQLRLLNGMTLLLTLSPILVVALTTYVVSQPPTLSDMLVAQYLQGNVNMSATRFESILGLREDLVRTLMAQSSLWAQLAIAALIIGAIVSVAQVTLAALRLRASLQQAYVWKHLGGVQIRISDKSTVAFSTRGLFTRYVVLPSALITNPSDLRLSVAHELQHFRQRDVECEFLLEALRPLLFWNPAYHLWRREVRMLREFACDQALMTRGQRDIRAYCECLIRACALAAQDPIRFVQRSPSVALVDRREVRRGATLARRIDVVTAAQPQDTHLFGWMLVSAMLATGVLATALLMQRPGDWSHDRIMLSTIVNLERMAHRNAVPETSQTAVTALQGGFMTLSK
ncbi:peptidase M56, BlaR1 [Phaeobacter sp. HS012]|uniref:M56 family metallopeptidase n=1 Tax=unclassified Phaeobacter TaxID=2621772 RepID=UPI001B37C235|nr:MULTISPECIES: M56 family metallopeptidase [unclassified Phaeobacter]MBQ4808567.1 peptidase M56, BlaR1 [Phaeobacter sp. HS012]MBQ4883214.1 peptidase M56, BlaR1 [Phaeobacter sp. HS011]